MQREQKHGGHEIHRHNQAQPSDPCTESIAMGLDGANEIDDHHEKIDGRTQNNCIGTSFLKVMHHGHLCNPLSLTARTTCKT
jgi:hypothetical protein